MPPPSLPEDLERLLHDLRGPLNAIAMHVEVIKRSVGASPAAKPSVDTIHAELGRMAQMLTTAFDIVALERRELGEHSLRALVEESLRGLDPAGAVALADGDWPTVRGDAVLLVAAIGAAVHAALESTREASADQPPEIGAESTPESVMLVVRDWGRRPPSTDPRFVLRLGPTSTATGLIGADRIARLHGGSLTFAAPPPTGREIRLTLPR